MTEKDRFDLFMSTTLGKVLSDEFKTYLLANGFFSAPASTKYHGAYEGGLFDHSFAVMNFLVDLSAKNNIKWKRAESPFIIGLFHDLCKIDQYRHPSRKRFTMAIRRVTFTMKRHGNTIPILRSKDMEINRLSCSLSL